MMLLDKIQTSIMALAILLLVGCSGTDSSIDGTYIGNPASYDKLTLRDGFVTLTGANGAVNHQGTYHVEGGYVKMILEGKECQMLIKNDSTLTGKGDLLGYFIKELPK